MKLRIIFFTLFGVLFWIVAWLVFSTAWFVNQKSMAILKDSEGQWIMTSIRETPLGPIEAEWWAEYHLLARDETQTCRSNGWAEYLPLQGNVSKYKIQNWAIPCLEEGPPLAITYARRVWLLGFIPLRPASFSIVINPDTAPALRQTEPVEKTGEQ